MEQLTIQQINEMKQKLQGELGALLNNFSSETSLKVDKVEVTSYAGKGLNSYTVNVTASLK